MGLLDILQQYATPSAAPRPDVADHFDQAAQEAPRAQLGSGIAAALRSDATPPFGQSIGALFGRSDPQQQAGLLNQIVSALGPSAATGLAGGLLGRLLGGSGGGTTPTVTPAQASQLSPAEVSTLAAHAEQHDPTIVDQIGAFYAQHPTLVKTLGAVALSAVMGHMSANR